MTPPDNSVDLTQLHTLIPGHADKQIDPTNWTDLKFYMKVNEPYGETIVQGRTVYEREAAVGCAKASEPSGPVEICFDAETVLTNKTDVVPVTDGQTSSTPPSVSFAATCSRTCGSRTVSSRACSRHLPRHPSQY